MFLSLSNITSIWWITKMFVSSKRTWVYILREKLEVFAILTSSLVIICRESIKRKKKKKREREWLCFSEDTPLVNPDPPLYFLQDELLPGNLSEIWFKELSTIVRYLRKNSFRRLPISGTKFKILFDPSNQRFVGEMKFREREREKGKKKENTQERKERIQVQRVVR